MTIGGHLLATGGKNFNKVGDQIRFTFPPLVSYWTFEVKNLDPSNLVELECVDAYHEINALPDAPKQEWLGSHLRWRIQSDGNQTSIDFTHDGLTPALQCYEVCETGWDMFFVDSLKAYLDTGVGAPFNERMV